MKKLLFFATLIALPFSLVAQTQFKINADIRGRSCAGGLGLCSVSAAFIEPKIGEICQTMAYRTNNNTLVFVFDVSMLSEQEQYCLLGKPMAMISTTDRLYLTQEQDLIIDIKTLTLLGIDAKYNHVAKGIYAAQMSKGKIQISIPLAGL